MKIGQEYFVETGSKEGGISCYTGELKSVQESGDFIKLYFVGGTVKTVAVGGKRRHGVYESKDDKGQDIRVSESDLIGPNRRGKAPGLELNVNWTRRGVCPWIKWRGLKNGNWT
jgi:hypothetical protein